MSSTPWVQDNFTVGELSPYMYARVTVEQYFNGLKTAKNALTYPQGGVGRRFGTLYNAELSGFTSATDIFFQTWQYVNECCYQILFYPDKIAIFLEGILINTVTGTGLDAASVYNLDHTVLGFEFRVSGEGFRPKKLTRAANSANVITGVSSNQFTLTTAITNGLVLPVRFTTTGTLPVTVPQIKAGVTYFAKHTSTSTIKIYSSSYNAANNIDPFTLSTAGTGTNNAIEQNTWTFGNVVFKNTPVYDFDGGYDNITFTPGALTGASVTITLSGILTAPASLTSKYVGGSFVGDGGVARIVSVTDTTHFVVSIEKSFNGSAGAPIAIAGKLCLLTEPAWSDARGWPQKCSSYQNRAFFANSDSLPNGLWGSAINDYNDFDDIQTDDDDAISWYPSSDDVAFIRFIVPYRSLTVHTNSGVFSNPLSVESAITPKNFSLQEQDSTPADYIQPRPIDNQIIIVSGNDVHSMVWDGLNNAYTSTIVSIMSEHLIRDPVDEAPFVDLRRAGSRYVFIINDSGSMAIYQTLIAQNVSGWTPSVTEQSFGNSYFRQVASNHDGRAWFITERQIAVAVAGINITAFTSSTLTAVATNYSTTEATPITFTTTGTLPTTTPQIVTTEYYWAIGVTSDTFKVYATKEDAENDENAFVISSAGTNSKVVGWPATTKFYLEELSFDTFLDCATYYSGSATATVTGLSRFNAQDVKMVGDGFGFEAIGFGDAVAFEAHGESVQISEAYIGFPVDWQIEAMPIAVPQGSGAKTSVLTRPSHIRNANFIFNNTIGGTVNGVPIALNSFANVGIGEPPSYSRGIFEFSVMKGWQDFENPVFTIESDEPFNIELLGIFYELDF